MRTSFLVYDIKNQAEFVGSMNSVMLANADGDINIVIDNSSNCIEIANVMTKGCCGQPEPVIVKDDLFTVRTQMRDNRLIRIISYDGILSAEKQISEGLKRAATGDSITLMKGGAKVHRDFISAISEIFNSSVVGGIFADTVDNMHYSYFTSLRPNKPFRENLNNLTFRSVFLPYINSGNIFDIVKILHNHSIVVHLPKPYFRT
jgi:hypothetical protein